MTSQFTLRSWLLALSFCAASVVLCIAYVDRPLATFLDEHVRHTTFWTALNLALQPLILVVAVALFFLFACGIWVISGRELPRWTHTAFLCSASTAAAGVSEKILKHIFGRGWPDPTFVRDHLYGFHFLRGSLYWNSFPSGTAAISTAILTVLWVVKPRSRAAAGAAVTLLLALVLIGNYHWLSDIMAGCFLGVSIGWATTELVHFGSQIAGER